MPLQAKKSITSGSLFLSEGQCVGSEVDIVVRLLLSIDSFSCLPLVVISLEPQWECLEFQSPPAINLGPRVLKKCVNCSSLILCFGGQYIEDMLMFPVFDSTAIVVAWRCSVWYGSNSWCFNEDFTINAVPACAVPSGCWVL